MSKPTRRELAEVVLELMGKVPSAKLSKAVASYLTHERRSSELDAVMRQVARLREQQNATVEVTLTSAFPLKSQLKKQLLELIDSKQTVVNEVIDKDVLGGVRMETSDQMLDLTVRNRLQKLKQGVIQ